MAGKGAAAKLTPEQIEEMEAQIRAFRDEQHATAVAAAREAAKPLSDLVSSPAFAEVLAAVPVIEQLSLDGERFPDLRVHAAALRNGLEGINRVAAGFVPVDPLKLDGAPVPAVPSSE